MSHINYGNGVVIDVLSRPVAAKEQPHALEEHVHTTFDVATAEADNLTVTGPITGTGDLSSIRNLRVAAHAPDPNNAEALLSDGLPKGFVFENATGTEQLDMIDDSSILVGTTAAKHTTVRDGSLGTVLSGTNNIRLDSAVDETGLSVRGDKDQDVAHLSLSRANNDTIFAVGRDTAASINEAILADGTLSVQRGDYTIQLMPSADVLFAVYDQNEPIYQIHSNGQPTHHKALGASHDVLASDDSLYVGSVRFSYDRQNHKIKGEKLKHQIPAQLAAANFTINDMPAGKVYADLSALDWLNVARDHMDDTSITASTLFATAGDWDTYYLVDEVMQAQVESLEDDVSVAQGTIISNTAAHTANAVSHAANTVSHTANTVSHTANALAITGKQATLSFVAVTANDGNPSTSAQIKTYVDANAGGGGSPTFVLYTETVNDEATGNGLTLNASHQLQIVNSFSNGAQLYCCRFNQNHFKIQMLVAAGYIANPQIKFVIFNTEITEKTTATAYLCKIQGNDPAGGQAEDEMTKMFLVHTAVAYRDPAEGEFMQSYLHVVVSSNKAISSASLSMNEGDTEDDIRDYIRNDKDDQSWDWSDQSLNNANEGTSFGLYVSLVHNNI